jgi:hypothetical protein
MGKNTVFAVFVTDNALRMNCGNRVLGLFLPKIAYAAFLFES